MALLRFESVSFRYPDAETNALEALSFSIEKGEYVVVCGESGCGKTTLASVIAAHTGAKIAKLNAVTAGVKDVRAVIEQAEKDLKLYGTPTYLLLDECHRWSKTQSDSILPALESGIDKLRINPGNIGADYKVKELCEGAKERRVPIRIGINSGCMEKELL